MRGVVRLEEERSICRGMIDHAFVRAVRENGKEGVMRGEVCGISAEKLLRCRAKYKDQESSWGEVQNKRRTVLHTHSHACAHAHMCLLL